MSLGSIAVGIAVLDVQARVLSADALFERILHEDRGLEIVAGTLIAREPATRSELHEAIRLVLCGEDSESASGRWLQMPGGEPDRTLSLFLAPLPGRQSRGATTPAVAVFAVDPDLCRAGLEAALAERYDLTAAETRLALGLADGKTLAAIAQEVGVTRETARWTLKQVFLKTGTRRQVDLVRLLLAGRPG